MDRGTEGKSNGWDRGDYIIGRNREGQRKGLGQGTREGWGNRGMNREKNGERLERGMDRGRYSGLLFRQLVAILRLGKICHSATYSAVSFDDALYNIELNSDSPLYSVTARFD
jgi:hypothetical protein